MKISVLQENIHYAVNDVVKCVSSRPQLPVLSCILIVAENDSIQLFATDLQFGMMTTIEGSIEEAGRVAVPAKVLADFLASLPSGQLTFSFSEHKLEVQTADGKASLQTFAAEDYPLFPTPEGDELQFPLDVFAPAVQATAFSASLDETRPVLTSLCLKFGEQLEIVGTDGFRLAKITLPYSSANDEEKQLLLPAKALNEAIRIAVRKKVQTVTLNISEKLKQVFFSFDGYSISMRLLEGQYPPYQKIMPEEFAVELVFDADEFQQKLKTASIFARDSAGIIRFALVPEGLKLSSSSSTYGTQETLVKAKYLKELIEPQEIAFNSRYVQEFLSVVKPKQIWFGMNTSLKPAAMRPEGMDVFKYVIMPFRVNS